MVKNLLAMQVDLGLIPGLGRSPGEGNSYPLPYSYLENSMDRGAWQATVHGSQTDTTESVWDSNISAKNTHISDPLAALYGYLASLWPMSYKRKYPS